MNNKPREWKINASCEFRESLGDVVRVIEYSAYKEYWELYHDLSPKYDAAIRERDEQTKLKNIAYNQMDEYGQQLVEERVRAAKLVEALEYAEGQLAHAGYTKNAVSVIKKAIAKYSKEKIMPGFNDADDILNREDRSKELMELRAENERLRLQLAGCSVAALCNSETTVKDRLTKDDNLWCASYGDVCDAVDREMKYRTALTELVSVIDYVGAGYVEEQGECPGLSKAWQAGLTALKKDEK